MGVTLIVLSAGMGSRFGGLKQIEPIGPSGEVIADYSVFDAKRVGFDKVVFVIKPEMEETFRERISDRISRHIDVELAFQELSYLPEGFTVPMNREKPWGTGHAALCCRSFVDGPCAVINADDFYGYSAFSELYNYLSNVKDESDFFNYCMVGYELDNTVSEKGYVSRGACSLDSENNLTDINELLKITKTEDGIFYEEDEKKLPLYGSLIVSMNCWGFQKSFFKEADKSFVKFLNGLNDKNQLTAEFYLPNIIKDLLSQNKARVKVLRGKDKWYGFTYKEDREIVVNAISELIKQGVYPDNLWK